MSYRLPFLVKMIVYTAICGHFSAVFQIFEYQLLHYSSIDCYVIYRTQSVIIIQSICTMKPVFRSQFDKRKISLQVEFVYIRICSDEVTPGVKVHICRGYA